MELNEYTLLKKDALSYLKDREDKSINLILTSPPYNIGKAYETKQSLTEYIESYRDLIQQMYRVLADNSSICWQVGSYIDKKTKEVYPLDILFYRLFKETGFVLRNRIVWHFGAGLNCKNRFSGRHETILWFTKGNDFVFNLDGVRIPQKYPNKKGWQGKNKGKVIANPKGKNPEDVWIADVQRLYDDWERDIWDIPNVSAHHVEKTNHPCTFPIELAERCVLALTNENDIVYDPFAGASSTLIASLKNNRKAIGTELVQEYIDISLDRISKLKDGTLRMRNTYSIRGEE